MAKKNSSRQKAAMDDADHGAHMDHLIRVASRAVKDAIKKDFEGKYGKGKLK